jgi:hypothetical protein
MRWLGRSRQVPDPVERLTGDARAAVEEARTLALNQGDRYLGCEQLLIVLARRPEFEFLKRVNRSFDHLGHRDPKARAIPTPNLVKVIREEALLEALAHGDNVIGPEHLLVGISCTEVGAARDRLLEAGLGPEELRRRLWP